MKENVFSQHMEAARKRWEMLFEQASALATDAPLVSQCLEELSISAHELEVAGEQLRQQNDELAYSREAIERERQRYLELFEFAPDGYLVTDGRGIIREANRAAASLVHRHHDLLVGKPLATFVSKKDHPIFYHRLTELQQGIQHSVQDWELGLSPRASPPLQAALTVSAVRDPKGRLAGLRWLVRDITRRRQVEAALKESEERFRVFMQNLPGIAFMKDSSGRYVFVNTTVEKMFRKKLDEWIGKTDEDLELRVLANHRGEYHRVVKDGKVLQTTKAIPQEDGLHYWFVNRFPVPARSETPAMVGVIGIDITAQKKTEEALRKSEKALQRSQEELRALTARLLSAQEEERRRVSRELHDDLNQQLALLTIKVESLERDLPTSPDLIREELEALKKTAEQLSDSVHRLAYQLHPAILDDLGLAVALQSYVRAFALREKIEVKFTHKNLPVDLPPEIASCLYRVTQEGLRNVARHARTSQATVGLKRIEDGIYLSIKDSGAGFDPRSVRSKGGLGIISMEERVRLVGGTLSLKSGPGRGTHVSVLIPQAERIT